MSPVPTPDPRCHPRRKVGSSLRRVHLLSDDNRESCRKRLQSSRHLAFLPLHRLWAPTCNTASSTSSPVTAVAATSFTFADAVWISLPTRSWPPSSSRDSLRLCQSSTTNVKRNNLEAHHRLQPWKLILCNCSSKCAMDSALVVDLGVRLVRVDVGRAKEVADTMIAGSQTSRQHFAATRSPA